MGGVQKNTQGVSDRKLHFMLNFFQKSQQINIPYIYANYHLISIFTFADRRHNASSTPVKQFKRGGKQKNTEGGGIPSHSD